MVKKLVVSLVVMFGAGASWASQDPTAPLDWQKPVIDVSKEKKVTKYQLPTINSIVCVSNEQCHAVMNNKLVEKGELFNGYRIAGINSEFVTLKRGNRQWDLALFDVNLKK
ncbi:MSHA biogenesis protein MshK [Vibrio sp. YIC-376]|uniref:MSHA biogenesis protein MshK n=1 Tax=Vibrio sp. YIC-376 TaxID=3136162 RepID=UPI00402AFB86